MNTRKILIILGVGLLILTVIILLAISLKDYLSPTEKSTNQVPATEVLDRTPALEQEAMDQIVESNRLTAPDVYLKNQTPVVQETFIFDAYIDRERKSYVFTVSPKISSLQEVQQNVHDWLIGSGLTEEQINSLIIEYTQ